MPADISLDLFVLKRGLGVDSLAGVGGYAGVSLITQAGLIYSDANGDGVPETVIGVQGGFQSNISYGAYVAHTVVRPISEIPQAELNAIHAAVLAGLIGFGLGGIVAALVGVGAASVLMTTFLRDPLDLDGDGIELTALEGSTTYFDYDRDGFAERTGWVSPDDGILVIDDNGNGLVDGAAELFGSPSQDGFEVLETLDTNGDGKIDAADAEFDKLRVWRDLDGDGVRSCSALPIHAPRRRGPIGARAGELMTLAEPGIASIVLTRTDLPGTTQGHTVGSPLLARLRRDATFTRTNGTTGSAQTIYFQTDRQDTQADITPGFTPAEGVDKLPRAGTTMYFPAGHAITPHL